ncbi:MAG: hypothetical protein WC843_05570 [Candidatus Gracilibacteria bacterium]|jgi:hypothetical protein
MSETNKDPDGAFDPGLLEDEKRNPKLGAEGIEVLTPELGKVINVPRSESDTKRAPAGYPNRIHQSGGFETPEFLGYAGIKIDGIRGLMRASVDQVSTPVDAVPVFVDGSSTYIPGRNEFTPTPAGAEVDLIREAYKGVSIGGPLLTFAGFAGVSAEFFTPIASPAIGGFDISVEAGEAEEE